MKIRIVYQKKLTHTQKKRRDPNQQRFTNNVENADDSVQCVQNGSISDMHQKYACFEQIPFFAQTTPEYNKKDTVTFSRSKRKERKSENDKIPFCVQISAPGFIVQSFTKKIIGSNTLVQTSSCRLGATKNTKL